MKYNKKNDYWDEYSKEEKSLYKIFEKSYDDKEYELADKKSILNYIMNEVNYNDKPNKLMEKWADYLGWDSGDVTMETKNYKKNCSQCGAALHGNTKGDLCKDCKAEMEAKQKAADEKAQKVMNVVDEMTDDFKDPTGTISKNTTKKKKEKTMSAKKNGNDVDGKSVLYNKHGMIYIDLHKPPEQNHLFAFNKTCMPKGLSIVCKGCNEEIEHYSQQFRSYYCPHCLVIYPDKSFDLDTQGGKKELEEWVELVRPIVPGAKKVKGAVQKEVSKDFEEAAENLKEFEESGGNFAELDGLFDQ